MSISTAKDIVDSKSEDELQTCHASPSGKMTSMYQMMCVVLAWLVSLTVVYIFWDMYIQKYCVEWAIKQKQRVS